MSGNLAVSTINGVDISVSPVATQAFATGQDLGVGQTWQNVTASRSAGVTYTNSTGKPIFIFFYSGSSGVTIVVDGINIGSMTTATGNSCGFVVPNGSTYSAATKPTTWSELR